MLSDEGLQVMAPLSMRSVPTACTLRWVWPASVQKPGLLTEQTSACVALGQGKHIHAFENLCLYCIFLSTDKLPGVYICLSFRKFLQFLSCNWQAVNLQEDIGYLSQKSSHPAGGGRTKAHHMVEKKHRNSRDKPNFHLSLRKTFAKHLLITYHVLGNLFTSVNGDAGINVKWSSILGSS